MATPWTHIIADLVKAGYPNEVRAGSANLVAAAQHVRVLSAQ